MSEKNNERSASFTEGEKTTLLQLVHKYKSILETKKTDAASNQKKSEVWAKLTETFNATSGRNPRDASNLRSTYDDLKKNLRKKIGNNQREMYKTGGGTAPTLIFSSDEELLMTLIGPSTFGLKDRGGGDKEIATSSASNISWKKEFDESVEFLESDIEMLIEENQNDGLSFRPSDAVDILKRPIQKVLASGEVECDDENAKASKSFPTLYCYEKPKARKPKHDRLDGLIEEYEDLKEEKKLLLRKQTKYYEDKNQREKRIFELEWAIKSMQKEEQELKLKMLKESKDI